MPGPQAAPLKVGDQIPGIFTASQLRPGDPFELIPAREADQALILVEPEVATAVLHDRIYIPAGRNVAGDKATVLEVDDATQRGDPDSATIVLKHRFHIVVG